MTPLTDARVELRQVREWLQRPSTETVDACVPALERAIAHVRELLNGPVSPSLGPAALELANEALETQVLLAAAGQLYFGRLRHLSESTIG